MDRGRNERLAIDHARIVDEVTRTDAIAAIDHQIIGTEQWRDVGRVQLELMIHDADRGIERFETPARHRRFGRPDAGGIEQHLALQIGFIDDIAVDQAERSDPGSRQVQTGR